MGFTAAEGPGGQGNKFRHPGNWVPSGQENRELDPGGWGTGARGPGTLGTGTWIVYEPTWEPGGSGARDGTMGLEPGTWGPLGMAPQSFRTTVPGDHVLWGPTWEPGDSGA